ncbi:unnamed protein product [Discosporangium mesarthrocarpum]
MIPFMARGREKGDFGGWTGGRGGIGTITLTLTLTTTLTLRMIAGVGSRPWCRGAAMGILAGRTRLNLAHWLKGWGLGYSGRYVCSEAQVVRRSLGAKRWGGG